MCYNIINQSLIMSTIVDKIGSLYHQKRQTHGLYKRKNTSKAPVVGVFSFYLKMSEKINYSLEYYYKNREKVLAKAKIFYKNNRERLLTKSKNRYYSKFEDGINPRRKGKMLFEEMKKRLGL